MHLVLLPTYNEQKNITPMLSALCALPENVHVLVIDDASPDGTARDVVAHPLFGERVFLLSREKKEGLGAAYRAGFAWGCARAYETLVQMDADFSHNPQDVSRLLGEIARGADVAIGSRKIRGGKIEGWGAWRMLCSTGAMTASRIALGLRTHDVTAGFRAWRRAFVETLPVGMLKSNGYAFQEEMILVAERAGGKVVEIPVVFCDRVAGESKLGFRDITEFFVTLARLTLVRRKRLLAYLAIGTLGAVVDASLFLILHYGGGVAILPANIFSASIAVLHNFVWHHAYTFRGHDEQAWRALTKFVLVSTGGIALNSAMVLGGVTLGLVPILAKGVAIFSVTLWNYGMNSRVTFRA